MALSAVAGAAYAATSAFTDVGNDHEHAAEIAAAHQIGVFNGYGDGTFRPDRKLTQRQAENVIWRMLSWHGTDDDGNFEITRADAAALAMTGLCGIDSDRIPGCAEIAPQAAEEPRASGASDPDTVAAESPTPSYNGPVAECPSNYHGRPGQSSSYANYYQWFYGGYETETGDPWCVQRSASISRAGNGIRSRVSDAGWCKTDSTDLLGTVTKTKTVQQGYWIGPEGQDQYVMKVSPFQHRTADATSILTYSSGGWPIAGEAVEIAADYINPSANTYRGPEVRELHAALTNAHASETLAAGPPARVLRWLGPPEDVAAACFDALRQ